MTVQSLGPGGCMVAGTAKMSGGEDKGLGVGDREGEQL